jgi:DNA-binding GntR family transcriptional regulator
VTAESLRVVRAPSLVDEAERLIRLRILGGELPPGSPLRDSVLADQMGISRSPVREALRILEQAGLVEKTANRSYRISDIAAADVPELAALRLSDEIVSVRMIVQRAPSLDPLDAAVERLRHPGTTPLDIAAADAAFHAAVVDLAGLPRLSARFADLTDQIRLVLLSGGLERTSDDRILAERHVVLVDALREAIASGDAEPAIRLWESHVLSGMNVPDLFTPPSA